MEKSLSQIPATNVLFLPREVSNHQAGAEGLDALSSVLGRHLRCQLW